ncbi:protein BASIC PENTACYSTEINE6 [Forsythia ovata]|uniref:Protein BASIC PENTACYSTEINE6 n=1 Tax=Forsythia ovata TaxID=205694 RepID=A0ABD1U611_9LAMI
MIGKGEKVVIDRKRRKDPWTQSHPLDMQKSKAHQPLAQLHHLSLEERKRLFASARHGNTVPDSLGNEISSGSKHIHYQHQMQMAEAAYISKGSARSNDFNVTETASETAKRKKVRQPKDGKLAK